MFKKPYYLQRRQFQWTQRNPFWVFLVQDLIQGEFSTHPDVAQKYSPFRSPRYGLEQNLQYAIIRLVLNQVTVIYQLGDNIIHFDDSGPWYLYTRNNVNISYQCYTITQLPGISRKIYLMVSEIFIVRLTNYYERNLEKVQR